jgi:hypothetical protein
VLPILRVCLLWSLREVADSLGDECGGIGDVVEQFGVVGFEFGIEIVEG